MQISSKLRDFITQILFLDYFEYDNYNFPDNFSRGSISKYAAAVSIMLLIELINDNLSGGKKAGACYIQHAPALQEVELL